MLTLGLSLWAHPQTGARAWVHLSRGSSGALRLRLSRPDVALRRDALGQVALTVPHPQAGALLR